MPGFNFGTALGIVRCLIGPLRGEFLESLPSWTDVVELEASAGIERVGIGAGLLPVEDPEPSTTLTLVPRSGLIISPKPWVGPTAGNENEGNELCNIGLSAVSAILLGH